MAKILCVLTGASYWTLKDGHRHPTGYWAEEFVAPYSVFTGAGHEVTVATPNGVVPVVDTMSLEPRMAGGEENALQEEAVIESADELRHPISLKDVHLEDYDAIYYPGGHGPMQDLSVDADSGELLRKALASGNPLAIVCHAPAALLATRDANGDTPFADYHLTGFCNEEEAGVGLADKAKWLLEDELKTLPTQYSRGPAWEPYTVVDRNLFTGQNPASSGPLAKELVKALAQGE
ncbi:type 1 glutamine amidotransferase domain-containing protein [Streptomyces sp. NEAU-YJ-81]|uniref:type 1 glutamine amidotransferase domain-containing protein n=1 Tax=Streptomyces sp. NEAU-YJ-81 TaxID=2820288 RepID=UPI001ABCF189|nr:type 1 glutamine amidotransferase domain-containing protein [Streptomyces sp. NEAU-YJ-81]MBO3675206.1 type 1 glutamine amidotransferase domain-containing protein [Streptomyces sp. NEAU-YJ-81]